MKILVKKTIFMIFILYFHGFEFFKLIYVALYYLHFIFEAKFDFTAFILL